jgi:hypothetical protein
MAVVCGSAAGGLAEQSIPTQMTWMIIVLLLKGGGNYCSIGLLDPIWKVVEKVMVA